MPINSDEIERPKGYKRTRTALMLSLSYKRLTDGLTFSSAKVDRFTQETITDN